MADASKAAVRAAFAEWQPGPSPKQKLASGESVYLTWRLPDGENATVRYSIHETADAAAKALAMKAEAVSVGTRPLTAIADQAYLVGPSTRHSVLLRRGRVLVDVFAPKDLITIQRPNRSAPAANQRVEVRMGNQTARRLIDLLLAEVDEAIRAGKI